MRSTVELICVLALFLHCEVVNSFSHFVRCSIIYSSFNLIVDFMYRWGSNYLGTKKLFTLAILVTLALQILCLLTLKLLGMLTTIHVLYMYLYWVEKLTWTFLLEDTVYSWDTNNTLYLQMLVLERCNGMHSTKNLLVVLMAPTVRILYVFGIWHMLETVFTNVKLCLLPTYRHTFLNCF